jgi:predicted acylesterase/phospholipase RssA
MRRLNKPSLNFVSLLKTDSNVENFWLQLAETRPYHMWTGGFIYGFFFKKGLYNPIGVHSFISNWFTGREIKRHYSLGVANIMTGAFASFER